MRYKKKKENDELKGKAKWVYEEENFHQNENERSNLMCVEIIESRT